MPRGVTGKAHIRCWCTEAKVSSLQAAGSEAIIVAPWPRACIGNITNGSGILIGQASSAWDKAAAHLHIKGSLSIRRISLFRATHRGITSPSCVYMSPTQESFMLVLEYVLRTRCGDDPAGKLPSLMHEWFWRFYTTSETICQLPCHSPAGAVPLPRYSEM
jgi:hypothetical protein